MNDFRIERLNEHVDALLEGREPPREAGTTELSELGEVAKDLSLLPHPEFRAALWANLASSSEQRAFSDSRPARPVAANSTQHATVIPPMFSSSSLTFPMRGSHLAVSFGLHVMALALVAASGWWVVENRAVVRSTVAQLIPVDSDYVVMPIVPGKTGGGGGGGGDRDKMDASHGTAPRFAAEQLTPPLAVVRNEHPALPAEPTLIGPPDIVLPQSDRMGDPMANILNPPSNGTGSGGGIGSGEGGGIGSGRGPGIGEGYGGGLAAGFTAWAAVCRPRGRSMILTPNIRKKRARQNFRGRCCSRQSLGRMASRKICASCAQWGWGWIRRLWMLSGSGALCRECGTRNLCRCW